jgi:hypothetical protein
MKLPAVLLLFSGTGYQKGKIFGSTRNERFGLSSFHVYFLNLFLNTSRPPKPLVTSSNVAGSGTGAGALSFSSTTVYSFYEKTFFITKTRNLESTKFRLSFFAFLACPVKPFFLCLTGVFSCFRD